MVSAATDGTVDWAAVAAIATIALAVVTAILAGATVYLGFQTRAVSAKTGALASTSEEEMKLLRQQATAMRDLADRTKDQLDELRESRFAEFLPMLRWQQPTPLFQDLGHRWQLGANIFLTNEGPGPARIRAVSIASDTREDWEVEGLEVPSTLASGVRIAFPVARRTEVLERRERVIEVRLRYADLLGEFEYETVIRVAVNFQEPGMEARFVDSDERSALERRLPRIPAG